MYKEHLQLLLFIMENNKNITYGMVVNGNELWFGCKERPMFRLKFKQ